jgi:hypothetical protein
MINSMWFVVALAAVGVVVALVAAWSRTERRADLGAVSSQWIAEHRLGQGHDPRA